MAEKVPAAVFEYLVDTKDGKRQLDDLSSGHIRATQTAREATPAVTSLAGAFNKLGALVAVGAVLTTVIGEIRAAIGVSMRFELAAIRLTSAIERAGLRASQASGEYEAYRRQLTYSSLATIEQINSQLALATSFGATGKAAYNLVQAGLDLAAATGTQVDAAVRNLALSLNGIRNETLQIIPGVTELTQEELKAGAAIELAAKAFGGAAQREVQTLAGATGNLRKAFEEVQASVGGMISEILGLQPAAETATGWLRQLNDELLKFRKLKDFELQVLAIDDALRRVADSSGLTVNEFNALNEQVQDAQRYGVTANRMEELIVASEGNSDALRSLIALELSHTQIMDLATRTRDRNIESIKEEAEAWKKLQEAHDLNLKIDLLGATNAADIQAATGPSPDLAIDFDPMFGDFTSDQLDTYNASIIEAETAWRNLSAAVQDATVANEGWLEQERAFIDAEGARITALEARKYMDAAAADATNMLKKATVNAAAAALTSAILYKKGAKEAARGVLEALTAQAIAKAVWEVAEGFAALALGQPTAAATHFKAAAIYGAVGAAAGVGARFLGSADQGGVSAGVSTGGGIDTTPPPTSRVQEITIFLEGQGLIQDQDSFARSIAEAINRQNSKAGV